MTPDQIEAERTKFEVWYRREWPAIEPGRVLDREGNGYWNGVTHHSWRGWLARAEEQYASEANNERGA